MGLELEIVVHEPKQRYTNGDTISGFVVVSTTDEIEVDQLLICCQCTSETSVGTGAQASKSFQQHFKRERNKQLGEVFSPGKYRFPFTFLLPSSPKLPETYSSGNVALNGARDNKNAGTGNVKWEIKASIPRFKIFDISQETSHQFWFIPKVVDPIYETNSEHSLPPVPLKLGAMFKKHLSHLYFTVGFRDSGIHQGPAGSGIKIRICSDTERLLYLKHLKVSLEATTIFHTKNSTFQDVSATDIFDKSPNLPLSFDPIDLEMMMDSKELVLPVMFYGSMQTPLIFLEYSLVIEATVSSFNDPKLAKTRQVKVPVVVRSLRSLRTAEPIELPFNPLESPYTTTTQRSSPPHVTLRAPLDPAARDRLNDSILSHNTNSLLGSAFNGDVSSSPTTASTSFSLNNKVTAPSFTTPITVPHDLPLLSRGKTYASDSPNTSIQRTSSSASLEELWEPEYDHDIAALVFTEDRHRAPRPRVGLA